MTTKACTPTDTPSSSSHAEALTAAWMQRRPVSWRGRRVLVQMPGCVVARVELLDASKSERRVRWIPIVELQLEASTSEPARVAGAGRC